MKCGFRGFENIQKIRRNTMITDALMIGIVLTLVFGSVVFYLYNRLSMAEKKMNLVEGVLTDIKIMMDSAPFAGEHPFTGNHMSMMQEFEPNQEYLNAISGPLPLQKDEIEEVGSEEDYQQTIEEAMGVKKSNDIPAPYRTLQIDENAPLPAINVTKLSPDLESMSVKELHSLAKQKGLTVPTGSRRKQLIELLKGTNADSSQTAPTEIEGHMASSDSFALQDTTL